MKRLAKSGIIYYCFSQLRMIVGAIIEKSYCQENTQDVYYQ